VVGLATWHIPSTLHALDNFEEMVITRHVLFIFLLFYISVHAGIKPAGVPLMLFGCPMGQNLRYNFNRK
jgi:hypothetical protein